MKERDEEMKYSPRLTSDKKFLLQKVSELLGAQEQ